MRAKLSDLRGVKVTSTSVFVAAAVVTVMPVFALLAIPGSAVWALPLFFSLFAGSGWGFSTYMRRLVQRTHNHDVLDAASVRFAAADSPEAMYDAAIAAAADLLGTRDADAVATLVMIDKTIWKSVATTRTQEDTMRNQWRIQTILQTIRSESNNSQDVLRKSHRMQVADRWVLYVPLVSLDEVIGAVVLETGKHLRPMIATAFDTLASQVALALDAAGLSDDLNRQKGDKRYRALVENSTDALFILSRSGQQLFASSAGERMLRAAGQSGDIAQAVHPKDRAAFQSMMQGALSSSLATRQQQILECRVVTKNGAPRWIDATATDMTRDPDVEGVVITARDVTDRKLLEADLRHRVLHDELTGISNLAHLKERVEHALSMRRSNDSFAALLFVNVNDFSELNETLGTDSGDELLKVLGFRIDNFVRGHDTAARMNNDEFAILLQDVASQEDVEKIASRLLKVAQMSLEFDGREITPSARIGVCIAQPDYDVNVFMRNTEVALTEAKAAAGSIAYFTESMTLSAAERIDLRRELALAIEQEELTAFYQPIFDLQSGALAGFEALVRWEHPEQGLVSPGSFIPLAEETGLIVPMGALIMRKACMQLKLWQERRTDLNLRMSINVAAQQLRSADFVGSVGQIMAETGIDPSALIMELTESESLRDSAIRDRLAQLRALNVGIAADDFGSGFASYSALQELPFTVAKIDRSLISGLANNFQKTVGQLRNVIEIAHGANLEVAVEGIEDASQSNLLTALGCDFGQGYFFGRPVAVSDADEIVTDSHAGAQSPA